MVVGMGEETRRGWGECSNIARWHVPVAAFGPLMAVLAVAGLFATTALQVALPQLVRVFIDRATSPDGRSLGLVTAACVAASAPQQAFRVLTAWLSEIVGWLTTNDLRADLMAHRLRLDPVLP